MHINKIVDYLRNDLAVIKDRFLPADRKRTKMIRIKKFVERLSVLVSITLASSCAAIQYGRVQTGEFQGKLTVTWIEPNYFVYEPDATDPLLFSSSDGRKIIPKKMYTDGGSIPPFLWGVPGYSPWGYAPAYIIHDWLFEAHHCNHEGQAGYTFQDSARLLSEGIKTLMENHKVPKDEFVEYMIYEAVSSPVAKDLWDNGKCNPPIELQNFEADKLDTSRKVIFTLDLNH
jgi:uncharacterized protein DUF1353